MAAALKEIIEEEKTVWHFDPMLETKDYWYIENIKERLTGHWETVVRFARELDEKTNTISMDDFLSPRNDDTSIGRNAARLALLGYNRQNTSLLKTYSDLFPEIFDPLLAVSGLANPIGSVIHQKPGTTIPWHFDTCAFYVQKFRIMDPKSVRRQLIFLEDWSWGHYLLIGNSVVHQWRAGDVISWPYMMRHLSANAGLTPKLTVQVTGKIEAV